MGKRILLVDDDSAVRDSIAMVLESVGFQVD
jgi:FixJ family two-component response regulator